MANEGHELWRDCASWLTRCGVLRPDHKANWETSQIQDLAYTLRDGVLLCNLLNVLDPGSLDMKDVNQKPQMAQFLCMRNIRVFIRTCHEKFELHEADLFEASMLFELSNFHRVLCTLAKLSQTTKSIQKNIEPFFVHRTQSVEDIYKNLQSVAPNQEVGDFNTFSTQLEEEIYHELCHKRQSATPSQTSTSTLASASKTSTRNYVIRELVDTECKYVEVIGSIITHFYKPLHTLLDPAEVDIIFSNIREIYEVNSTLLEELKKATEGCLPGAPKLSDVFLRWREKFTVYGDYCCNMPNSQSLMPSLESSNKQFHKTLIKLEKEYRDGKNRLKEILTLPFQRILKYHLLLQKLVEETAPTHEEYRNLERAKEAMRDVADYINELKRDMDALDVQKRIEESIIDWKRETDLQSFGRLLMDGELKIMAHDDQRIRTRYAFVFHKLLLLCKLPKDNQYSFRNSLLLSEYRVEKVDSRRTLGPNARMHEKFYLVRRSKDGAYTLYLRSETECEKWMDTISKAIENLEPPGCRETDHKFTLKTFDKPVTCHHCSKFLKGKIFQGYCCSACSTSVHKQCIKQSGRCGGMALVASPLPVYNINDNALHYYMWYAGEMGRERATSRLERRVDGTFLLRVRPAAAPRDTHYALSLKADNTVKHMRVCCKIQEEQPRYYLSESRFFKNVIDLVSYYETNSLSENFIGLNTTLRWPYRRIVATVTRDFRPLDQNQLGLRARAKVLVISKEGDSRGWWRGRSLEADCKSGYFPKDCVREEPETLGIDE